MAQRPYATTRRGRKRRNGSKKRHVRRVQIALAKARRRWLDRMRLWLKHE
jgi:hypothetical protein